jgi:hypothetical protein
MACPSRSATWSEPITTAPAWRLAELIRTGAVSPVEVLEAHLARITAVNGKLNALISERFADARRHLGEGQASVSPGHDMAAAGDRHGPGVGTAVEGSRLTGSEEFGVQGPTEQLEDQFAGLGSQ